MARGKRVSKGRTMRPCFFVFCEGETEVAYVQLLRSIFRVPIDIIPRKSTSNITAQYIERCMREHPRTDNDRTFLMYDLDKEGILDRLKKLNAVLLVSNPCIELWFLLHCEDCVTELDTRTCIKKLKEHFRNYTKGKLTPSLCAVLSSQIDRARQNASHLTEYSNPSTTVYRLLDALETDYKLSASTALK